ncbi:LLM class flavin-dependent oxidoreductase [Nocardiopsis protaetiae]|uniref:LLM class flavin-dependent oxidoreductase n=1 Tax=Nocardiopsis protaetiae TaxID=3382270 RepID=UPI00387B2F6D
MAHPLDRPLIIGVALDGAGDGFTAADYVRAARLAEDAGLDFATLDDSLTGEARPDALLTLAAVAPRTRRIGLVPAVTVTHTEPFHVSKAVASLDFASRGRAGWRVEVSRTGADARAVGRRATAPAEELWAEATAVADVVARLWDSWEDDAEIRDVATGRFIDRDKLHYVDFEGPGWSVRGPSITPRPPQGHPLVVVRAEDDHALATAAAAADAVIVTSGTLGAVRERYRRVREEIAAAGRDPDAVTVLAEVHAHLAPGRPGPDRVLPGLVHTGSPGALAEALLEWGRVVDGFAVRFGSTDADLPLFTERTVPLLRESGVLHEGPAPDTLRARFGLGRPANRYEAV